MRDNWLLEVRPGGKVSGPRGREIWGHDPGVSVLGHFLQPSPDLPCPVPDPLILFLRLQMPTRQGKNALPAASLAFVRRPVDW